jgi:asparagine synthase (glutamine-hydrolysing)
MFVENAILDRGEWTFFKNIKRFPHAHFSKINIKSPERITFHRYWSAPQETLNLDPVDAARELNKKLNYSVNLHLVSDVPVGACLSGGLDSSAIVCLGSRHLANQGKIIQTFTTEYSDYPQINEAHWAQKVLTATKANGHFVSPTFDLFKKNFERVIYFQDEPFGSTSIFSQYFIFEEIAKAGVKVVLDGQGSDEVLAGYHSFIDSYLDDLARRRRWTRLAIERQKLKLNSGFIPNRAIWDFRVRRKPLPLGLKGEAYDEFQSRMDAIAPISKSFNETLVELTTRTNIPQLLRYEDRDSMAHSIESRVPFLEPELVGFGLSLSPDLKIRGGYTKAVLRDALKGVIPEEIRNRKDKLGFPAPEIDWLDRLTGTRPEGNGSLQWRQLIVKRWREVIQTDWKVFGEAQST